MEQRFQCRCCGYYTLVGENEEDTRWEICPVCFWENDIFGETPDKYSGANHMTLAQGRENYKKYGACEQRRLPVRKPRQEELPGSYNNI